MDLRLVIDYSIGVGSFREHGLDCWPHLDGRDFVIHPLKDLEGWMDLERILGKAIKATVFAAEDLETLMSKYREAVLLYLPATRNF